MVMRCLLKSFFNSVSIFSVFCFREKELLLVQIYYSNKLHFDARSIRELIIEITSLKIVDLIPFMTASIVIVK